MSNFKIKVKKLKKFNLEDGDVYHALKASESADAIILLTEWDIYKSINWNDVSNLMRHPAWIFDTRSIIFLKF